MPPKNPTGGMNGTNASGTTVGTVVGVAAGVVVVAVVVVGV